MYAQIWLWTIAQALIISNWFAGFSGIIAWTVVYYVRVPTEEKMMMEEFGSKYLDYMNNTGRVLPKKR
jgi:protein-S-isoprenylcysteine O-methyltransferase Ste14